MVYVWVVVVIKKSLEPREIVIENTICLALGFEGPDIVFYQELERKPTINEGELGVE